MVFFLNQRSYTANEKFRIVLPGFSTSLIGNQAGDTTGQRCCQVTAWHFQFCRFNGCNRINNRLFFLFVK